MAEFTVTRKVAVIVADAELVKVRQAVGDENTYNEVLTELLAELSTLPSSEEAWLIRTNKRLTWWFEVDGAASILELVEEGHEDYKVYCSIKDWNVELLAWMVKDPGAELMTE